MPHQIDTVIEAIRHVPWAMHEQKLREIEAFLVMRSQGWDDYQSVRAEFAPREGSGIFRDDEGKRVDVDGIRYLTLFGVMSQRANMLSNFSGGASTEQFISRVNEGLAADDVKTLLIHADSPGGVFPLVPEASQVLREGRKQKRIVTIAEGQMASAAFWVGTGATETYATKSTSVGSQGVYTIHTELSKAYEENGVKNTVIRGGENKAIVNRFEPLSAAAKKKLQKEVDDANQMFIADVALNRGVTQQFVLDRFGQGASFLAEEAAERKMIDGVLLMEEVIDRERRRNANRVSVFIGGSKMTVSDRVKAALLASGVIESMEVSAGECVAYVRGLAKAKGKKLEELKDEEVIALVLESEKPAESSERFSNMVQGAVTTGIDANGKEYIAAVAEPLRQLDHHGDERIRVAEITAVGRTLKIAAEDILSAQIEGITIEEARKRFTELAAKAQPAVSVVPGDASQDKISHAVSGAMLERCGYGHKLSEEERSYCSSLSGVTLMEMARSALQVHNIRPSGDLRTDARRFLELGVPGRGPMRFDTLPNGSVRKFLAVDEPSVNRHGDHPDALSSMMGRMLDLTYPQAEVTYPVYARQLPDMPDFRPKSFMETAAFQELELISEDEKHQQLKFETNFKGFIEVARFGNKVGMTIEMVVDDDLGVFAEQLETLGTAPQYTVDNKCRTLLTSNPNLIDGTALFDASRGNIITSGAGLGAPGATTASEHRRLHRLIKGFGRTRPMNLPPVTALVPAAHEEAALQTFLVAAQDAKIANTDANINTVRGLIRPTIDSMLDAFSADKWYTFSSTRIAPIVYAFLRGTGGPRGTRTTWSDPDTGTRYVAVDMTFGLTALNFRGAVLNNGA